MQDDRHLFSLPTDLHYLNCASRSPMLNATRAAGDAAMTRQVVPAALDPSEYFARSEQVRDKVARLARTAADRVAIIPSVSYGISIATYNCDLRRGQNVVLPEEEFLSDVYGWIAACQRNGAVLRSVARPSSALDVAARWSEAMMDAIDEHTAVVNLSSVHWTDGLRFDVGAITARAREVGALVVVDVTQSLGALEFDFEAVGADLVVCADYKWLFGPYQLGVALVGDRLLDADPFEHHWSNRAGSEDTSRTGYTHEFRPGARRFDVGEHTNDISLSMLDASLDQVLAWGCEAVEDYCRRLCGPLEHYLAESPYRAPAPSEHCAHILGIRADDPALMERAASEATRRNIRLSRRGSALRVAPHRYNTAADIDALIEALRAAAH